MLILVSGFPRSGSTWIYGHIIDLLSTISVDFQALGRIDNLGPVSDYTKSSKTLYVAKAPYHSSYYQNENIKVIFIQRNHFDVAASAKDRWFNSSDENSLVKLSDWFENDYLAKLRQYSPFSNSPNTLWLRYEDLYDDSFLLNKLICKFLRLPYIKTSSKIEKNFAVSNDFLLQFSLKLRNISRYPIKLIRSFLPESYQKKRFFIWRRLESVFPKYDTKTLIGPNHVSLHKGKPSSFMTRLTQEEIKAIESILLRYKIPKYYV